MLREARIVWWGKPFRLNHRASRIPRFPAPSLRDPSTEERGRFHYLYYLPRLRRIVLQVSGDEDGLGAMRHFEKGKLVNVRLRYKW
jgi:hypothetical protein